MRLPTVKYSFKLLTVCFCGGADSQGAPAEMRIPSIRGQVRLMHRELSSVQEVNRIWGSTTDGSGASRVGMVLDSANPPRPETSRTHILPHKRQGSRPAIAEGRVFSMTLQRLVGCTNTDWEAAQKALKAWLILGCLGLRSNRAAGSVWPVPSKNEDGKWIPQSAAELGNTLRGYGCQRSLWLVDAPVGTTAENLRCIASDTVKNELLFGDTEHSSPTKFKVVLLNGQPRLLVSAPTSPSSINVAALRRALSGPNKAGTYNWLPV
jgi:hypothetical protein